jgi:uncharacterized membrane protein
MVNATHFSATARTLAGADPSNQRLTRSSTCEPMTSPFRGPSLIGMRKHLTSRRLLVPLACTAVVSLMIAHLIDLGTQTLGSGPASTAAVVGDLASLAGCALSVALGLRFAARSEVCR